MKSENDKESKYPMTYEEFEKRVSKLFLDGADSQSDLEFRQYILNEEVGDLIECEYKNACSNYVNPNYHSNQFTDEGLLRQPVRILEMI
ncbi:hypothetical protein [uncultured Methanobrevibacter sp.]|uniref:hypothetical protein n=1 Tax=uncultured Methanobrevibacter sp. TaxID=253161 RepID=UPI00260CACAA|nr:hypothetical protein [uncultured Methanobrevibacter sp.]